MERLQATTLALARVLCETRAAIAPWVATTLALETLNGMAKMAPMTEQAMARVMEEQKNVAGKGKDGGSEESGKER